MLFTINRISDMHETGGGDLIGLGGDMLVMWLPIKKGLKRV